MVIRQQVTAVLNKKMDRQDFIKHVAIGMVALSGAGTALRLMTPPQQGQHHSVQAGYGGSSYGGIDEQKK